MQQEYLRKLFSLDGKRAIVTGGNSGIGMGCALSLAQFGADVAIIGRDQATLDDVKEQLVAIEGKGSAYKVDISKKAEVDAFFDAYYKANDGKLDILIANAGISYGKRALETTEEEANTLYSINVNGTLFCCQRAAEAFMKQFSGDIVIVTSVNALWPLPPQAVYTSTKAALEAIMQCLAVDLAPYNVRVNTLAPGGIRTNLGRYSRRPDGPPPPPPPPQPAPGERRHGVPMGRIGEPVDMGDAVACMVSDAFRYMTGSTVLVDGGLKLRNI